MHEIDRREKPERHLTGGEGGKEGAACFCAEIASCSTSQRIKIHRSGVRTGPLVQFGFRFSHLVIQQRANPFKQQPVFSFLPSGRDLPALFGSE